MYSILFAIGPKDFVKFAAHFREPSSAGPTERTKGVVIGQLQ